MRRRLRSSTFDEALNSSFSEVETWAYQVQQVHYARCFTPAVDEQRIIKHEAGWAPDDVFFSPWDNVQCWATKADREAWGAEQVVFHATAANKEVTLMLVKFPEKEMDIDRQRSAAPPPTSTGGTSNDNTDSLGIPTTGVVNTTTGTVRKNVAPKPPSTS